MKKFLRRILLFIVVFLCAIPVFFLFGLFIVGNQYQETYSASIIDKVARLKSINEPKIIIVGNSNLPYGINSAMIESAMNMPVVNLGLTGYYMTDSFLENIAKLSMNSGDIIIAGHSNFTDDGIIHEPLSEWTTIEYHFDLWPILDKEDYFTMIIYYPSYWLRSFALWITRQGNKANPLVEAFTYSRRSLNKYGDIPEKPEVNRGDFRDSKVKVPEINDRCVNRLNKYNAYIKSKGATFLIAGYPILENEFTPPKEEYDKFQRELESRVECEVISNYRDYFIPYKYFYDSHLHLDNEGAKIRTGQLIKDLKRWQSKQQNKTGNL
ncbi:MAG: hypothetical protein IJS99_02015 [Synergistaceae bacterium]|nr:hypothetical protein [Synergistaceae bacterium]